MKILAIETSTEACSAALSIDGEIQVQFEIAPQQHSRLILSQCEHLLNEANLKPAQLDAVAFGQGPGSFTGVRIAAGVTQGIAFAHDLPVIGISTLAAQAQKICIKHPTHYCLSAIDARMKEIYWGVFKLSDKQQVEALCEESVDPADTLLLPNMKNWIGVGSGWKAYSSELNTVLSQDTLTEIYPDTLPSAKEVAQLAANKFERGEIVSAENAIPVYLRNNIAKKSVKSQ